MAYSSLSSTAAANILDWVFNGVTLSSGQRWLALDVDPTPTECTDGSYARYDLAAAMPTPTSGSIASNVAISANTGSQTVAYWRIVTTSNSSTSTTLAAGSLNTSKTGAFSIAIGDITGTEYGV